MQLVALQPVQTVHIGELDQLETNMVIHVPICNT